MKPIEEMTISEIRELKEKYRDEFRELVKNFLEDRPTIDVIGLHYNKLIKLGLGNTLGCDPDAGYYGDYIPLDIDRLDEVAFRVYLECEKI